MTHDSSFNIRTPHHFLHEMIIPQYEEFRAKNSSSMYALLTIILVYHMYEWVHCKEFNINHFRKKYENKEEMAQLFELVRKIANGTKHFKPRAQTKVQSGFSSGFSNAFARPLIVEFDDGNKQSVDDLLYKMVEFWKHQEQVGAFGKLEQ